MRLRQRELLPELLPPEPDPRSAGPAEKHLRVCGVHMELGGTRVQPVWGSVQLERPQEGLHPVCFLHFLAQIPFPVP